MGLNSAFGLFLIDLFHVCKDNFVILFVVYSLLTSVICGLVGRKHINNIFISSYINDTIAEIKKRKTSRDPDKRDLTASNYVIGSGYSMFADVMIFIARFFFCFAFASALISDSFADISAVLFNINIKIALIDYLQAGDYNLPLILLSATALIFQFILYYIYESDLIGDHKIVDYISIGVMALGILFCASGFVFIWLFSIFAEALELLAYKTILWDKKMQKTAKEVEKALKQYDRRLDVLKQQAKIEKEKTKRNHKK